MHEENLKAAKRFVDSAVGKSKLSHKEIVTLFELYNSINVTKEVLSHCDMCVIRVFSALKKQTRDVIL